jgi:hypothetical protein
MITELFTSDEFSPEFELDSVFQIDFNSSRRVDLSQRGRHCGSYLRRDSRGAVCGECLAVSEAWPWVEQAAASTDFSADSGAE